jgi:type II secretory pathway component PulJ
MVKKNGWTLLEVVVTLAVSSIFFAMVFSIISSLIINYKTTEKLNKADTEMSLLMQIFQTTIDQYNSDGLSIKLNKDNKTVTVVVASSEKIIQIVKDDNKITEVNYRINLANEIQSFKLNYIKEIEFNKYNGKLLQMKITDENNRIRQVVAMVVKGENELEE